MISSKYFIIFVKLFFLKKELNSTWKIELERANMLLKKIAKLLESKNISLLEAFLYLDSNSSNKIS